MMMKADRNRSFIPFLLLIVGLIPLGVSLWFGYLAFSEWSVRRDLAQGSLPAVATVTNCTPARGYCHFDYRFSATQNGLPRNFAGSGRASCNGDCLPVGRPLPVRYLPDNPTRSAIDGYNFVRVHLVLSLAFALIYPIVLRKQIVAKFQRGFGIKQKGEKRATV
jgi:hypothetical protein